MTLYPAPSAVDLDLPGSGFLDESLVGRREFRCRDLHELPAVFGGGEGGVGAHAAVGVAAAEVVGALVVAVGGTDRVELAVALGVGEGVTGDGGLRRGRDRKRTRLKSVTNERIG